MVEPPGGATLARSDEPENAQDPDRDVLSLLRPAGNDRAAVLLPLRGPPGDGPRGRLLRLPRDRRGRTRRYAPAVPRDAAANALRRRFHRDLRGRLRPRDPAGGEAPHRDVRLEQRRRMALG